MSLIKVREPRVRNLGAILSKFVQLERIYNEAAEDIGRFYAPSECYADNWKAFDKAQEKLLKEVEQETGLTYEELVEEAKARTSPRYVYFNLHM